MNRAEFEDALEDFRLTAQTVIREHYAREGYTFAVPGVRIASRGKRYAKLVSVEQWPNRDGEKESGVHSFVEIETGDIFKAQSFRAPAKHARGNIFDNAGASSLTAVGGIRYLK